MHLEDNDRQQLIQLLIDIPILATEQGRRQMLELAGLGQLTTTMTLSGDTFNVVSQIVSDLSRYGYVSDNQTAVGKFLNIVKDFTGLEQRAILEQLLTKYQKPRSFQPKVPQIPPPRPYPQSASPTQSNAWKVFIGLGITAPLILGLVFGYESLTNINLNSERGVNYTRLQNLLAAGKWGEADDETAAITRKILGINKTAALYIKDINTFPCTDLRTIEQLWLKYSNKRFGFSQQKQLWESLGGLATVPKVDIQEDDEIFNAFKEKVGWTKDTSERNVPKGYFPKIEKWWNSYQPGWLETIFLRVDVCKADI
jgi:GUN4-like/Effector-associated domain 8